MSDSVQEAFDLDAPQWLVEDLWGAQAVGRFACR